MSSFEVLLRISIVILHMIGTIQTHNLGRTLSTELQIQFCEEIDWICLNGTPYQRCGGNVCFSDGAQPTHTDACCKHKQHVTTVPPKIACCGDETHTYNPAVDQCCADGRVGRGCCGNIAYDSTTLSCCSDGKIGAYCCGSIAYDNPSLACCSDGILGIACCGYIAYDNTLLSCCGDGKLGAECCGTIAYDSALSQCCSDGIIGTACCGGLAYDDSALQCCRNGDVGPLCCGDLAYTSPDLDCCNDILYDPVSLQCCGGSVASSCCGGYGYNEASLKCCSPGNVGVECCGLSSYDPTQVAPGTECCGNMLLDSALWLCCGGIRHSLSLVDTLACCDGGCTGCPQGGVVYDNRTYMCCDSVFIERDSYPDKQCCAGTVYDTIMYYCEDNWVKPFIDVGSTAWFMG